MASIGGIALGILVAALGFLLVAVVCVVILRVLTLVLPAGEAEATPDSDEDAGAVNARLARHPVHPAEGPDADPDGQEPVQGALADEREAPAEDTLPTDPEEPTG